MYEKLKTLKCAFSPYSLHESRKLLRGYVGSLYETLRQNIEFKFNTDTHIFCNFDQIRCHNRIFSTRINQEILCKTHLEFKQFCMKVENWRR